MMVILVAVAAAASDYSLVSQLRDVGEDIYGKFYFDGIAEVPGMDSATTELHILVPATRHLGLVSSYLKKSLQRRGLSQLAQVSRLDRSYDCPIKTLTRIIIYALPKMPTTRSNGSLQSPREW